MSSSNASHRPGLQNADVRTGARDPVRPPRAIVIGASSGIGRALAWELARAGYVLGLVARRADRLFALQREIPTVSIARPIDVADHGAAMRHVRDLIDELGGIDLFVVTAGVGQLNPELDWQREHDTLAVNVTGFAAMMNVAAAHLQQRGRGQLVAISSVAAVRGNAAAPGYNASKAFVSNYLDGLRLRFRRLGLAVTVTEVRPGFVDTAMAQGAGQFWVVSPERAAAQIWRAIRNHEPCVYVTRRWRLIAWLLKLLPERVYVRLTS